MKRFLKKEEVFKRLSSNKRMMLKWLSSKKEDGVKKVVLKKGNDVQKIVLKKRKIIKKNCPKKRKEDNVLKVVLKKEQIVVLKKDRMKITFLMKLSLIALSEKLLPIPPYPPSSPPWESDLNIF